ncbi:CCA tRNA nucleotidyltransferase [hydrothermal vent metagenome]|uniref:CCA tRNA nucleotidyltransferase n=1 Tax=hydrothermal vent metagenome TaxID=652676 RepID=A0A3B0ZG98_9ZZZZ
MSIKIYTVGGFIRDHLLGITSKDKDWVVVGATAEQMLAQGYKTVGKDFPVFLHPKTKQEYALARTERKTAAGYTGFSFNTNTEVTLEDDLMRRDLTINAIAQDEEGNLIDPYNGQQDIKDRILRHVSPAFVEDPLRVLRVARFAARFANLGFTVAEETRLLMQQIVQSGEIASLVAERVWQELHATLQTRNPEVFFELLRECGALKILLPELDCLFGVPQTKEYHPEIDTGIHTLMVLEQAVKLSHDPDVRFAALVHDLGKGLTPKNELPKHIGHEHRGIEPVKQLCNRFKTPKSFRELALIVTEYHLNYHRIEELKPKTVVKYLQLMDAFRRPERFEKFLLACEADSRGRTGLENKDFKQPRIFRDYFKAASEVDYSELKEQGLQGKDFAERLTKLRVQAVASLKKN